MEGDSLPPNGGSCKGLGNQGALVTKEAEVAARSAGGEAALVPRVRHAGSSGTRRAYGPPSVPSPPAHRHRSWCSPLGKGAKFHVSHRWGGARGAGGETVLVPRLRHAGSSGTRRAYGPPSVPSPPAHRHRSWCSPLRGGRGWGDCACLAAAAREGVGGASAFGLQAPPHPSRAALLLLVLASKEGAKFHVSHRWGGARGAGGETVLVSQRRRARGSAVRRPSASKHRLTPRGPPCCSWCSSRGGKAKFHIPSSQFWTSCLSRRARG